MLLAEVVRWQIQTSPLNFNNPVMQRVACPERVSARIAVCWNLWTFLLRASQKL